MSAPLRLLETMRAERGRIALLDLHLARLSQSASDVGYPLDLDALRQRLAEAVRDAVVLGVRLTLGSAGDLDLDTWTLTDASFRTVVIHPEPMPEAGGPLCTHKTTHRDHYDRRWAWAREHGADEALVLNEKGEITEGTRTTVWVERGGRLVTPPLTSGGLAGVMRAHILSTREVEESVLTPDDLRRADALYLSNALRGWMPVTLVETGPSA